MAPKKEPPKDEESKKTPPSKAKFVLGRVQGGSARVIRNCEVAGTAVPWVISADFRKQSPAPNSTSTSTSKAGKRKKQTMAKPRQKNRNLVRWKEVLDQKLLIYLMKVCNKHGIKLPWGEVGQEINGILSEGAIVQHIAKLRQRLAEKGEEVPQPLRRGGNSRAANKADQTDKSGKAGNEKKPIKIEPSDPGDSSSDEGDYDPYKDYNDEPGKKRRKPVQSNGKPKLPPPPKKRGLSDSDENDPFAPRRKSARKSATKSQREIAERQNIKFDDEIEDGKKDEYESEGTLTHHTQHVKSQRSSSNGSPKKVAVGAPWLPGGSSTTEPPSNESSPKSKTSKKSESLIVKLKTGKGTRANAQIQDPEYIVDDSGQSTAGCSVYDSGEGEAEYDEVVETTTTHNQPGGTGLGLMNNVGIHGGLSGLYGGGGARSSVSSYPSEPAPPSVSSYPSFDYAYADPVAFGIAANPGRRPIIPGSGSAFLNNDGNSGYGAPIHPDRYLNNSTDANNPYAFLMQPGGFQLQGNDLNSSSLLSDETMNNNDHHLWGSAVGGTNREGDSLTNNEDANNSLDFDVLDSYLEHGEDFPGLFDQEHDYQGFFEMD